jgi:hypothetical protein
MKVALMEDDGNMRIRNVSYVSYVNHVRIPTVLLGQVRDLPAKSSSNRAMFEWHQADVWRYLDGMCQGLKAGVPVDALEYGKVAMVGRPGWSIVEASALL